MNANTLALHPALRTGANGRHERPFLDFLVDGVSLLSRLGAGDFTSVLAFSTEALHASVECLLLRATSPLPSGRVPLYVCPECGDLACGALCASITRASGHLIWSSFAYESGAVAETPDVSTYSAVGPFRFPADDYVSILAAATFNHSSA